MDGLLPHYQHELHLLAQALDEFAKHHPKIAMRLGIHSGQSNDAHVDRLMQTFAFLAARIDSRLNDDYLQFTEALLELSHPHYLRGVPSCAIARFRPDARFGQMVAPLVVSRGASLDARNAPCRFRTVYDVALAPLRIQAARYTSTAALPSSRTQLPADATGILSITFASAALSRSFDASIPMDPVRVHLSGERPVVATLLDTLLWRSSHAYVEADRNGHWIALSGVPFEPVGFDNDERLLPPSRNSFASPLCNLMEYFAFPEMFDFIDVDLGRMRREARAPGAQNLTLHVAVRDTPAGSPAAQLLETLDTATFELFCTPVVNLFRRRASSILMTPETDAYPVQPVPFRKGPALGVYSIDTVYLGDPPPLHPGKHATGVDEPAPETVPPYRAFMHWRTVDRPGVYWLARRDPDACTRSRAGLVLSLVGLDERPAKPKRSQLDVDTTATNGELPSRLRIDGPEGALIHDGSARDYPVTLITVPTRPVEFPHGNGALWQVLSMLTPQQSDLARDGLPALKAFLRLHVVRSIPSAQRSIDALVDLNCRPTVQWMTLNEQWPSSLVRGIEITLSFDEAALQDVSLCVLAGLLERFFARHEPMDSYVQLVVRSAQTGRELMRGAARVGIQPLI